MPRRFTVLLVEDDPSIRKLLSLCFRTGGFEVEAVDCAEQALSRFDVLRPDAVLTDVGLPGMDGAELTQRLNRETDIPVFMMSGQAEPARHEAREFFAKPIDPDRILMSIQNACERREHGPG